LKEIPQAWPMAAHSDIFSASFASATLFCTAPAAPKGGWLPGAERLDEYDMEH